jgi:hypothetical protein
MAARTMAVHGTLRSDPISRTPNRVRLGKSKGELHGETALRIYEELGDLTSQAHM